MSFENSMRVMASGGSPEKGESRPKATGQALGTPSRGRAVGRAEKDFWLKATKACFKSQLCHQLAIFLV